MSFLSRATGLLLCLLTVTAHASVVLTGKTSSKVTGHVVRPNNLFVTDENGGWYQQALALEQGGREAYSIAIPVRVISTSGTFQVHMDSELRLQHQANPQLLFRNVTVSMGLTDAAGQLLAVGNNVSFTNPASAGTGQDSIGHYLLKVSGLPPAGNFMQVMGTYSGVLSLTFEPVVK